MTRFLRISSQQGDLNMRTKGLVALMILSGLSLQGQTLGEITGQVGDASHAAVASHS
jgi:hypothetical protein